MDGEAITMAHDVSAANSRRGALTAMLAGSALGLAALGGISGQAAARDKKVKHQHRGKHGKGKGKGDGNGGGVGAALPSVRFVQTTTTVTNSGLVSARSKCPNGFLPIGGGFFSSVDNPVLLTSMPREAQNDWYLEIDGAQEEQQVTVIAVCLAATIDPDAADEKKGKSARQRSGKQ